MKVLFCGLKYDYGKPHAGLSFEYQNFYEVLRKMQGVEADLFAIDEEIMSSGRDVVNAKLIHHVEETKPDLLFCFLFQEEIKKETIEHITTKTNTKTFNWFADDHWRLPIYSRYWAPLFTAVSTTDSAAVEGYKKYGIKNVIKTQWACNPALYQPQDPAKNPGDYKITFVGQSFGPRAAYIETLKAAELPAQGFGGGWPSGRISFEQMLEIFSYSTINLNFVEIDFIRKGNVLKPLARLFLKKTGKKFAFDGHNIFANLKSLMGRRKTMIKGRNFEVPGCGGFLLTGHADNLGDYYDPGKEIAVFKNKEELIEKCRYYLEHEDERRAIAKAGYERTLREHTYEHRFREIFKAMGLA